MAVKAAAKQRGRPFRRRSSGNPAGCPPGARNRTTPAVEELLSGEADWLTRKRLELALGGDSTALRLCMERLAPPPKDRPVTFPIRPATTAREINITMGQMAEAVGAGTLSPGEGNGLAALFEIHRRVIESADLEDRIERLEKKSDEGTRR